MHEADTQDRAAAYTVLSWRWGKRLKVVWVDGGYAGRLVNWAREALGLTVEVVKNVKGESENGDGVSRAFQVLPRRWVVERTFAWMNRNHRLSKDYERNPVMSDGFAYLSMTRVMLHRLAPGAA